MRKPFLFVLLIALQAMVPLQAQEDYRHAAQQVLHDRGEVYFSFELPDEGAPKKLLAILGKSISIDRVDNNKVYAYANQKGWRDFLTHSLSFTILDAPSTLLSPSRLNRIGEKKSGSWDYYPSYNEYLSIMQGFRDNYPKLCELVNIGKTTEGRDLLFIHFKPSDSLVSKPQVMYTATMHGDEALPYVLMLELIDDLLKNYPHDPKVGRLLDSLDIWINPLANPDGTYASGNASVSDAHRFNANGVDLNRNFPDPDQGNHPDENAWQPETKAFMDFSANHHFVLSVNMHTGSEVANYPWDTWSRRHADDGWWQTVCRQYADTVQFYSTDSQYFTDLNNGITNGYDWYHVAGGRQDYMNYFDHCREFTLEMSEVKMPAADLIPDFWEWNHRALLNYMAQALTGIHGWVFDSVTRQPLSAKIFVMNHDTDHSEVYSALPHGDFYRFLMPGTYSFLVSREGYQSKRIDHVEVKAGEKAYLKIPLTPLKTGIGTQHLPLLEIYPNPAREYIRCSFSGVVNAWEIVDVNRRKILSGERLPKRIGVSKWPAGWYFLRVQSNQYWYSQPFSVR